MNIHDIMTVAPVIPVLVLDEDGPDPVALAETLVEAGLPVIEVTLRTDNALDAMEKMAGVDGAIVGAGTVLGPAQLLEACDYGAQFIVSPGLTETLVRTANDKRVPILPGVASAGEIMRGMEMGLTHFKFFPAEANGGLPALKAISAPLAAAKFCPTGGVKADTAMDWLAHPSVLCVGGSWILPTGERDLDKVAERARAAASLKE